MIEKIVTLTKSELKTKDNKEWLEVTDQDGIKYSVWENKLWNILGKDASANISFESKGQFKNILKAESVKERVEKLSQVPPEIAPQERGMWWKELGECIRAKVFTKDTPEGFAARATYFAEMFRVLNIKVEKPSKTS